MLVTRTHLLFMPLTPRHHSFTLLGNAGHSSQGYLLQAEGCSITSKDFLFLPKSSMARRVLLHAFLQHQHNDRFSFLTVSKFLLISFGRNASWLLFGMLKFQDSLLLHFGTCLSQMKATCSLGNLGCRLGILGRKNLN